MVFLATLVLGPERINTFAVDYVEVANDFEQLDRRVPHVESMTERESKVQVAHLGMTDD